jgi:hypothetical protein
MPRVRPVRHNPYPQVTIRRMSRLCARVRCCPLSLRESCERSPQLADQLLGKAQAESVELLGPHDLLSQVTEPVLGTGAGRGDERPPGL